MFCSSVGDVAKKTNEMKMESATEQMTDDPKYGGEVSEEKSESEGKSWKEGEDDEEVVNKEVDLQEAKSESSGDPEEKETEVENSDSEGKQENNEMEEAEAEDDAEISDNETLVCTYLSLKSYKQHNRKMSSDICLHLNACAGSVEK